MCKTILSDNIHILGILHVSPQAMKRNLQKPEMLSHLYGKKSSSPSVWHLKSERASDSLFVSLGKVLNYMQLMLCRIFFLNCLIYEVIQGVHSSHRFTGRFSMGHELLLSKKEDCSEEETGKPEPISRQNSISHCSITADCVEHFCNILRSIWQCSLVRNAHNNTSWHQKLLFVVFFQ